MHIKSLATILVGALATAVSTKHAFATQNFLEPTFWPGNSRVEGPVFFAHINDPGNGAVRMWEFYNTVSEEYFYTTSGAERASIPVQSPGIYIDFKGWIASGTEYWTWPGPGSDKSQL